MSPSPDPPSKGQPTLFQLPAELLYVICSMLPMGSQGCLALTCKTYHTQFKSIFRDEFFRLARPKLAWPTTNLPPERWVTGSLFLKAEDRAAFMIHAQTARLRHCASCRKLHSQNEFEETELSQPDDLRSCKWPGIAFTNCRVEPTAPLYSPSVDLENMLPWRYIFEIPELGLNVIPSIELTLERDTNNAIIAKSVYSFRQVPVGFSASHTLPMVCPHISFSKLLLEGVVEWTYKRFGCPACKALVCIDASRRGPWGAQATSSAPTNYLITVTRNLGQSTLSGQDLWWRLLGYSYRKSDLMLEDSLEAGLACSGDTDGTATLDFLERTVG